MKYLKQNLFAHIVVFSVIAFGFHSCMTMEPYVEPTGYYFHKLDENKTLLNTKMLTANQCLKLKDQVSFPTLCTPTYED